MNKAEKVFDKLAKKKKKNEVEHVLTPKSFLPAAATAGVLAGSNKALKDLENVRREMVSWDSALASERNIASQRKMTFQEADKTFNKYIKGGRKVSRTPVLGIPAGRIQQAGTAVYEHAPLAVRKVLSKVIKDVPEVKDWERIKARKRIEHYKLYSDPKVSPSKVKTHMIEKALGNDSMGGVLRDKSIVNDKTKKIIFDTDKYKTLSDQHKALQKVNPKAANVFEKAILGEGGTLGEAVRLSGNKGQVVSTPGVYKGIAEPYLGAVKDIRGKLKKYTLPAVGAVAAIPLIKHTFQKLGEKKKKKEKEITPDAAAGAAIVAGTAPTAVGVKKILKPNKEIAITYGEMPTIGFGHKSPGQAIKNVIEDTPELKKAPVRILKRNQHSVYRYTPKKFSLLIDTGLGAESHAWTDPTTRTHGVRMPDKVKASNKLRYLTDALTESSGFGSNIHRGGKILAYGPNTKRLEKEWPKMKVRQVGKGMTPAVDVNYLKKDKNVGGTHVIDDLIKEEKTKLHVESNKLTKAELGKNIERLNKLKGKKLITVVGAGRGDYVASRSNELVKALKNSGLDKEYGVLPIMSGSKGNQTEKLLHEVELPSIGKVKKDLYHKVQQASKVNWGSSGTSSVTEALTFKNIQALPKQWGTSGQHDKRVFVPNSIAERQDKLLGTRGPHASLDDWNKGNIDYMLKRKGTLAAESPEDIVKVLKDPKQLKKLETEAVQRSGEEISKLEDARKTLKSTLVKEWKTGLRKQRGGGAALAVAGLAGIGYGVKRLLDKKDLI